MKKIILTISILIIAWISWGIYLTTHPKTINAGVLSVLTVQQGGTGASTLTGCVTANGTAPFTASGSCGSGGGGSSAFEIATTTGLSVSQLSYFTKTSGRTTIGGVATGTVSSSGGITVTAAQSIIGSGLTVGCTVADASNPGCLSAAKFSQFNSATTTFTSPLIYSVGTNAVTCQVATASVPGCISAASFSKHDSATTTFSTGLTYSNATNAVTVNTSQNIATLSNLTSNGLVYTAGGGGTLNTLATSTFTGTGLISVTAGAYVPGGTPIVVSCPTCGSGSGITSYNAWTNSSTLINSTLGTLYTSATTSALAINSLATTTIFNFNGTYYVPTDFSTNGCAGNAAYTTFDKCVHGLYSLASTSGRLGVRIVVTDSVPSTKWTSGIAFDINGLQASLDCNAGVVLVYGGTATSTLWNTGNPTGHTVSSSQGCIFQGNTTRIAAGQANAKTTVGLGFGGSNGAVGVEIRDTDINGFGQNVHISNNAYMLSFDHVSNSGGNGGILGSLVYIDKANNSGERNQWTGGSLTDPGNSIEDNAIYITSGGTASNFFSQMSIDDAVVYIGASNGMTSFDQIHFENAAYGTYGRYTLIQGVSSDLSSHISVTNSLVANDTSGANAFDILFTVGGPIKVDGLNIQNYGGGTISAVVDHSIDNGVSGDHVCNITVQGGGLTKITNGAGGITYSRAAGIGCSDNVDNSYSIQWRPAQNNVNSFMSGDTVMGTNDHSANWTLGAGSGSTIQLNNSVIIGTANAGNFQIATTVTGCLQTSAANSNAYFGSCGSSSGGSFPFSADTNYGQVVYSTSTPTLWFKSGLFASSTSYFTNISASNTATSTIGNFGGILDATSFAGSDIGAQVNAAYAACPLKSCIITIPRGSFSFSTPIILDTNGKRALLRGAPAGGTELTYTGTATSTRINWGIQASGIDHTSGCGIQDVTLIGNSYATSSSPQIGLEVGGANGSDCTTLTNVNIQHFGYGLWLSANEYHFNWYNGVIRDNGQLLHVMAASNSGEDLNFYGAFLTDGANLNPWECIWFDNSATENTIFHGGQINDCHTHILQANNISFFGTDWENPGAKTGGWAAYTYITIDQNIATNVSFNGDTFFDTALNGRSPTTYISNGGTVTLNGVIVRQFNGNTVTNFITTTGSGRAIWTGFNNVSNTAVANVVANGLVPVNGTTASSSIPSIVGNAAGGGLTTLQNLNSTGYTSLDFYDDAGTVRGGMGIGGTGVGAPYKNNFYIASSQSSADLVLMSNAIEAARFIGTNQSLKLATTTVGCLNTSSTGVVYSATCSGGLTSYDAWTHSTINPQNSATTSRIGIGTTTPYFSLTIASSTGPQLSLSDTGGVAQWTFRNANGSLYLATTTTTGNATTTTAAIAFTNSQILIPDGTGSAPSISFLDDTNNGIGSPANDVFAIYTNGLERFRVHDGTGSSGFGTTTFSQTILTLGTSTAPQLTLADNTAGDVQWATRNAGGNYYLATTSTDGTSTTTKAAFSITNGGVYSISTSTAGCLNVTSSGNWYVATCSSGTGLTSYDAWTHSTINPQNSATTSRIGIGTTTPYFSLTIASSTGPQLSLSDNSGIAQWTFRNANGNFYVSTTSGNATTTGVTALSILQNGGAGFYDTSPDYGLESVGKFVNGYFGITNVTDGDLFNVSSNGTTGIGTTTPSILAQATIASSTASQLLFSDGTAGDAMWAVRNAGANLYFSTTTTTGAATTSTAALSLIGNGKPGLSISSTTPNAQLVVNAVNTTDFSNLFLVSSTTGVLQSTATTTIFRIDNNGSVYAPKTAASGSSQTGYWCYDGTGQLIRDTAVCLVSARKFKTDIEPLDVGLDDLMKIDFVSYLKKEPLSTEDSHRQMGVIADDVAKISPALNEMLVTYVGGGTSGEVHSFRYDQFTALLGQSIKDLTIKVNNSTLDKVKRSAEENWQWVVIGLLVIWNLYLTFRKRK